MPDLRYHLISLVAVFLALAVGILLGVAMSDRGIISDRLQAEITDVNNRLDRQQREILRLREHTARDGEMMQSMSEFMVADRLSGVEVALVAGPYADRRVLQDMQDELPTAGAQVVVTETLSPPEAGEVTTVETTTELQSNYTDVAREALQSLVNSPSTGDAVLFLGGGRVPEEAPPGTLQALNEAQADMFELWLDANVRVVAAEPADTGRSEVELFQSVGVPSVDNADQPPGMAAVVYLIRSDDDGSYGVKPTASELFPVRG